MKIKLFTHVDLDGIGCAIVAKHWALTTNAHIDISYCDNDEIDEAVTRLMRNGLEAYDRVYISDLSVNPDIAARIDLLEEHVHRFELYDHHISAVCLNDYSWAHVVPKNEDGVLQCGTSLLCRALFSADLTQRRRLNQFVEAVRLWDTWTWKDSGNLLPQIYSAMLKSVGRTGFIECVMPTLHDDISLPADWRAKFEELETKKLEYIREACGRAFVWTCPHTDKSYVCVFASDHISELGNTLACTFPECDAAIIIGEHSISLRSVKDGVNVSSLASRRGGGGHPQAAGFNLSQDQKQRIMNIVMEVNK